MRFSSSDVRVREEIARRRDPPSPAVDRIRQSQEHRARTKRPTHQPHWSCHGNDGRCLRGSLELANVSNLVCPPSVSAECDPAFRLALPPLHPELSGRLGIAGRTRARCFVRNDPALGAEIRAKVRQAASRSTTPSKFTLAFRRNGRLYRRQAHVSLAGRR